MNWLALKFAGLGAYAFHWGVSVGVLILLLVAALGSRWIPVIGPYLKTMQRDLLWGAAAVAIFIAGQFVGTYDATNRCKAKTVVIEKIVTKVVEKTKTPAAVKKDDPFNSPDN